jgi:hypothetical protein
MKKFLSLCMLGITLIGYSQQNTTISYGILTSSNERPKIEGEITEYIAKDGSIYKVGDQVTIGVPSSNKTFAFLSTGDGIMTPLVPLGINVSGQKADIIKFRISGTRRSGFTIWLKAKSPYGIGNYNVDFENAILNGEIKSYGMTSNEALEELKRTKEKLDLGLITQEEYETKKKELVKFIK